MLAVLGSWLLSARPAQADPTVTPEARAQRVELSYVGNRGCPNEASFVHEVAARIRRPIEWVTENPGARIHVTVAQGDGHADGTLQIVAGGAEPTRREFTAGTCAEISSALALVAALALDPNARTEALSASDASPPAPTDPEQPPSMPAPSIVAPVRPVAERKPPAADASAPPAPHPAPSRYVAWLAPSMGVDSGYAPEPLISFGLTVGARAKLGNGLSPSVELTPSWGKTGVTGPAAPGGSFAWALARLEACPVQLRLVAWLSVEPCLAGEVGRLAATSHSSANLIPVPADRWWAGAGAAVALRIGRGRWFSRLQGRGVFPATRDTFVLVDPYQRIHRAAVLTYGLGLAVGVQFER